MNSPLRALVVDDERPARKWMRELLAEYAEIQVVGESADIETAVRLSREKYPDVIFLDVQMSPANGFDLLPLLDPQPKIVFVTAHDTFALKAFEANALDYLLKPVHPDRLAETIRRLTSVAPAPEIPAPDGKLGLKDLVTLRDRGMVRITPVGEISAIEAEAAYSRIHLSRANPMMVLQMIGEWEARLPSPPFVRIDRSLLVNLTKIRAIDVITRDETHLTLEGLTEPLRLGRLASVRLRRLLSDDD